MTNYDPALVERMVALVRKLKDAYDDGDYDAASVFVNDSGEEARAIAAELPAPEDPDLLLAREAVADMDMFAGLRDKVLGGTFDNSGGIVSATLAAIKRVRAQG